MKTQHFLAGLILASLSAACSASTQPTATLSATQSALPVSTATPTQEPTETPVPSPTDVPITPICSPLRDHELSKITNYISNPYAEHIGSNRETGHHGLDFSYYRKDGVGGPIDGTVVQSMLAGRVAGLGFDRLPYGNMMVIETPFEILPAELAAIYQMNEGQSLYLLYGHMLESPNLAIGDQLGCGEALGQVGGTGFSGNPHLHLETRVGPSGIELPTMIFYETTATRDEQAAYLEWRTGSTWTKYTPMLLLTYAIETTGANQ